MLFYCQATNCKGYFVDNFRVSSNYLGGKVELLTLSFVVIFAGLGSTGVRASDVYPSDELGLTPEQQAVLENYETSIITYVVDELTYESVGNLATTRRAVRHRGSFLMWTEDNVEWTVSNGSITRTQAWQRAGFVFPNTSRNNGISRHQTNTTFRTYRGSHTTGAGVVTPWGDVNVHSQSRVYFVRVNTNGTWTWWE